FTDFGSIHGTLVFWASTDRNTDPAFYRSDGTPGGTVQFTDGENVRGGISAVLGDKLYFTRFVPGSGADRTELWATDGTGTGTQRVDFITGNFASELLAVGGKLFAIVDQNLYVTDGSAAGTSIVLAAPNRVENLTDVNGTVFFNLLTTPRELWKTDGTAL